VPPLADRFLSYGPRDFTTTGKSHNTRSSRHLRGLSARSNPLADVLPKSTRSALSNAVDTVFKPVIPLLDALARIRVPHDWFGQFYLLSVLCSVFWGWQVWTCGAAYVWVLGHVGSDTKGKDYGENGNGAVEDGVQGLVVCWVLLLVQGLRRTYETMAYVKKRDGKKISTMWVGHWIMGLFFYTTVNIAFWIERIGKSLPGLFFSITNHHRHHRNLPCSNAPTNSSYHSFVSPEMGHCSSRIIFRLLFLPAKSYPQIPVDSFIYATIYTSGPSCI
jgi:hypothetical protein